MGDRAGDMMQTVAALYVDLRGIYSELEAVEPWGLPDRDARMYAGPHPVVAHPPCSRWCRLAGLVEARWGHRRGEDGGCFAAALASVRAWGGVLEHPAYSDAWSTFSLPRPPAGGGGWQRGICGGWSCHVEQARYGHAAHKATWLYYVGEHPPSDMLWGASEATALVSWCGNRIASGETRPRLGKRAASASPPDFASTLVALARQDGAVTT